MTATHQPTTEELQSFIDGELDDARAAEIAAMARADEKLALRISELQAVDQKIREQFGPLIYRPLPTEWVTMIRGRRAPHRLAWPRRSALAMAASVAVGVLGWSAYRAFVPADRGGSVVDIAVASREVALGRSTTPAAALRAEIDSALVTSIGANARTPDLAQMGFEITGYRVTGNGRDTAVRIDYRDGADRLFTVYLQRAVGEPRFDMLRRGGTRICVWQDDTLAAVMLGEISAGEMMRLASRAYSTLTG